MYTSFNPRAVGLSILAARTLELAAQAGFSGVDLLVRDLIRDGDDPAALRRRMDDLGLVGGAWPLPVTWRGDEATFRGDLAALPRYADAASRLGLGRTGTWVMPEIPAGFARLDPDAARLATLAFHADRLGAILDVLDPLGIRLGLEVIGVERFRSGLTAPFLTKLGELTALRDQLQSKGRTAALLLDTFHLYAADETLEDALAAGIDQIAWVHVADLPMCASPDRSLIVDEARGLPGEHGTVDNRRILSILLERGYDGPVTAEPLGRCRSLQGRTPESIAQIVGSALRSVWPTNA